MASLQERLNILQSKVNEHNGKMCAFTIDDNDNFEEYETDSCYDMKIAPLSNSSQLEPVVTNDGKKLPKYKTLIVDMTVNTEQHTLLQRWFMGYILMYNAVITHINGLHFTSRVKEYKEHLIALMKLRSKITELTTLKKLIQNATKHYKRHTTVQ